MQYNKHQQDIRIYNNLKNISNIITILSGKGGVGKSTVAVNLAYSLASEGHRVGIMDIDIHGPNIPKMLGIENKHFASDAGTIYPVSILDNFQAASIGLVGYSSNNAFIWRGPMKIALVRQFLGDIFWDALDYLVVDTPPGTGDEALTLAQLIPSMKGVVIVSTPQELALLDSSKSLNFAEKLNLVVLGIIENMSGYICPHCGNHSTIFGSGGAKRFAKDAKIPFLGSIPLDPGIVASADYGSPIFTQSNADEKVSSKISNADNYSQLSIATQTVHSFQNIITNLKQEIMSNNKSGVYDSRLPVDPDKKLDGEKNTDPGFRPVQ